MTPKRGRRFNRVLNRSSLQVIPPPPLCRIAGGEGVILLIAGLFERDGKYTPMPWCRRDLDGPGVWMPLLYTDVCCFRGGEIRDTPCQVRRCGEHGTRGKHKSGYKGGPESPPGCPGLCDPRALVYICRHPIFKKDCLVNGILKLFCHTVAL